MKRRLLFALAAFVCLGLFLASREAASWRPQVLGKVTNDPSGAGLLLSFSPDSQVLLSNHVQSTPNSLLDLNTGQLLQKLPVARTYAFSPNSQLIAVVNDNQGQVPHGKGITYTPGARFLDVKTGRSICVLRAPDQLTENWTFDAAFSPDGRKFFIVTPRSFYEFNAATGQLLHRAVPQTAFDSTAGNAYSHKISPDARHVVAFQRFARIYDIRTGAIVCSLRLSEFGTEQMGWSPDGAIVWESSEQRVRFWNAQNGKFIRDWANLSETKVVFTPDSKHFAVAKSNRLELRDVLTGKTTRTFPGPRQEPFAIAPDGTFAVSVENGKLLRWRLK